MKDKTTTIDGFTITPSYRSQSGTICKSIQNYIITNPLGMFGTDRLYISSLTKSGALEQIAIWYNHAWDSKPAQLSRMRKDYVQWLCKVFPGADSAVIALEIIERNEKKMKEEEFASQEELSKAVALTSAAPELLAALKEARSFFQLCTRNGEALSRTPGFRFADEKAFAAIAKAEGTE